MLIVPHVIAGAALGSLIGDVPGAPVIAFAVGWASHYVLDSVPHWERLYKSSQNINWETHRPAQEWPRHIFVQAAIDVLVAGVFLYAVATNTSEAAWWDTNRIFWGGLGAAVPDLLGNVPFWNRFLSKLPGFKQEYAFHSTIHISPEAQAKLPKWLGLLTQVLTVTLGLWVLMR